MAKCYSSDSQQRGEVESDFSRQCCHGKRKASPALRRTRCRVALQDQSLRASRESRKETKRIFTLLRLPSRAIGSSFLATTQFKSFCEVSLVTAARYERSIWCNPVTLAEKF